MILIIEPNAQGWNRERVCPKISSGDSVYVFITPMSRDRCKPLLWPVEARNKCCCVIFIVNHSATLKCNREQLWSHKQWGWHQSAGGIDGGAFSVFSCSLLRVSDIHGCIRNQSSMLMSCLLKSFPNISVTPFKSSLSDLFKHDVAVGWRW